jgi:osmotically-inducible protein OsmY
LQETTATLESEQLLDLQRAVEGAIWKFGQIRPNLSALSIEVLEDGSVELAGPVRSSLTKEGILQAARLVPGVTRVVDRLISDAELEFAVAQALAEHSKTKDLWLAVHSHMGSISLVGKLPDQDPRSAAIKVAGGVPGVREVVIHLS